MGTDEAADHPPAAWHADPYGRHEQRWWDGARWTEKVREGNMSRIDPPGIEEAPHLPGEAAPADPIEDAPLPLKPPSEATQIALLVGTLVLVGIVVLIIAFAVTG
jgi:hypothetical protein